MSNNYQNSKKIDLRFNKNQLDLLKHKQDVLSLQHRQIQHLEEQENLLYLSKLERQHRLKYSQSVDKITHKLDYLQNDVSEIQNQISDISGELTDYKFAKDGFRKMNKELNNKDIQSHKNLKQKLKNFDYQPYSVADYKTNFKKQDGYKFSKSLGDNKGSPEWALQNEKLKRRVDFAQQANISNKIKFNKKYNFNPNLNQNPNQINQDKRKEELQNDDLNNHDQHLQNIQQQKQYENLNRVVSNDINENLNMIRDNELEQFHQYQSNNLSKNQSKNQSLVGNYENSNQNSPNVKKNNLKGFINDLNKMQ